MMGNVESSWHKLKNKLKLLLWMNYWSDEKEKDQIRDILCCVLQEKYTFVVFWVTERRRRVNEFFPRIIACKQKRQRQNLSMQLWMLMWFLKDKHKAIRLATHHLQITKHRKQHCSEELMHGLFAYLKKNWLCWKCSCSLDRNPRNPNRLHLFPDHCTVFQIWIRYACQIGASKASEIIQRHTTQSKESSLYSSVCQAQRNIQSNYRGNFRKKQLTVSLYYTVHCCFSVCLWPCVLLSLLFGIF